MWRALTIAALTLAAASADAQTVVARSGEHAGFSRLVMRLPAGAPWSLRQSGQSAQVVIDTPTVVFDTSRVFDLIPRTRLQSVSQAGPGQPLQLQLGCNCDVSSFVQKDGYLVVDIADGTPGADQPLTAGSPLPLLPGNINSTGYRFNLAARAAADARAALDLAGVTSRSTTGADQVQRLPVAVADTPSAIQLPLDLTRTPRAEVPAAPVEEARVAVESATEPKPVPVQVDTDMLLDLSETERAATVNESEQRLLQQISRATNQGLLELVGVEVHDGTDGHVLDPLSGRDRPLNPLDQISVTSSVDRESGLIARRSDTSGQPTHCLPSRQLAVHDWGTDEPFADQISPLRADLVREFDDVDPKAVLTLARAYLFFGFGAEAQAILRMMPSGAAEHDDAVALTAMGAVLDGQPMEVNHTFAGQQVCDSEVALWAALADGTIKKNAKTDAIQQAFAKLPPHLRVQVGPRISTLFAKAGDPHLAGAALRSVDRTGVEHVPEINLAEAEIARLEGDVETVAQELTDEVAERTENAPRALIELIDLSFAERSALSPDVPDLAASYEVENRDSPLGADLRRAVVAALALTGEFHDSFSELEALSRRDGPAARTKALEPVLTLLTERADDVTFLQYALVIAANGTTAEVAPVADIVAERLLDLGFAQQAQSILKKLAMEPGNTKRRLILAKAALAMDKPHSALVELMGLSGSAANKLRAEALWRNGEYARAGEYLLEEEEKDAATRGFWHSEDRDTLATMDADDTEQFGGVARVTTQIEETAKEPTGLPPLAHARALVESSEGTRGGIADLLQKVTPQADPSDDGS
ncbi:hypothetical protein [Phaeobacter piscinae]|uniref:hypothetical protein n=1 Tax=Phaeobacter piscinae TaxID=1580596 RepID=UPI0005907158|nr:hypothetical protein [Phaeobacter piscinae]UTS82422.1 hypothetical protein OL67_003529 [Phaeobacter piscinae]